MNHPDTEAVGAAAPDPAATRKALLIRNFAHDIKNPLGAANGRAELLLEGVVGELTAATREQIEAMRGSVRKAIDLVSAFAELARVEAGQVELQRDPVELGPLARQVAGDHAAAAAEKGLTLDLDEHDAPTVTADAERVRQIIDALVSNAVRYTDAGSITIVVEPATPEEQERPGAAAAVRVRDTGRGVPADSVDELFEAFTRFDTQDKSGFGLALAIGRGLARLLGGDIVFEAAETGSGSTFSLLLP